MNQIINEDVGRVFPVQIQWRNREYKIDKIGMHYKYYEGKKLLHVFSVVSRDIFFKLILDTENLHWKIAEVADGEV